MKKLDDEELFLCRYIADLFEYASKMKDCSSKVFIKAYLFSSIRERTASRYFIFESLDIPAAYNIIKREKKLTRGKEIYPTYVMAWIGYIMKYFACSTNRSEKYLYKYIKPEELASLYEAYHSLDNDLVIRRICESKNINIKDKDIELYKRIKFAPDYKTN